MSKLSLLLDEEYELLDKQIKTPFECFDDAVFKAHVEAARGDHDAVKKIGQQINDYRQTWSSWLYDNKNDASRCLYQWGRIFAITSFAATGGHTFSTETKEALQEAKANAIPNSFPIAFSNATAFAQANSFAVKEKDDLVSAVQILEKAFFELARNHAQAEDLIGVESQLLSLETKEGFLAEKHLLQHLRGACLLRAYRESRTHEYLERAIELAKKRQMRNAASIYQNLWLHELHNELRLIDARQQADLRKDLVSTLPKHIQRLTEPEPAVTLDTIHSFYVGHTDIVQRVVRLVKQKRQGYSHQREPLVLWFSGASGVGKTYFAQLIAKALQKEDGGNNLEVIDCQNIRTQEGIHTLTGSPPGLKGKDGKLTAALTKNSKAVIVLDEFEKAEAPQFESTFLPIFQKNGFVRSLWVGEDPVSTKDAIFILTSNLGKDCETEDQEDLTTSKVVWDQDAKKLCLAKLAKKKYSEPFKNRATENFFHFEPLNPKERNEAAINELLEWARDVLSMQGSVVWWSGEVVDHLAQDFEQFHGARISAKCSNVLFDARPAAGAAELKKAIGRDVYVLQHNASEGLTAKHIGAFMNDFERENFIDTLHDECKRWNFALPGVNLPTPPPCTVHKAVSEFAKTEIPPPTAEPALPPEPPVRAVEKRRATSPNEPWQPVPDPLGVEKISKEVAAPSEPSVTNPAAIEPAFSLVSLGLRTLAMEKITEDAAAPPLASSTQPVDQKHRTESVENELAFYRFAVGIALIAILLWVFVLPALVTIGRSASREILMRTIEWLCAIAGVKLPETSGE